MEQYKYYSTQRPVDIGTFPKPADNPPVKIVNYNQGGRVWMEHDTILAWGELIYAKPLSAQEIASYELKPSRQNPDLAQTMYEQAQVVGEWEKRNQIPEQKRLTWWYTDMGTHVVKEYVTAERLMKQYKIAQEFPKIPRTGSKKAHPSKPKRKGQEPDR